MAPLGDSALVLATIAQTLGVKETAGQRLLDQLKSALHAKLLLLLLDNFEHLLDAAPLVVELLEACRGLKALVTSRAALHVRGERLYAVPPLLLPDLTQPTATVLLARNPAVALFVEHAQAVTLNFRLTEQNAAAVGGICVRLEGLPLAIELAATRVKLLAPETLLARLEQRLALLTDGARDLPPRHRTLRAAIDWSFELLDASEQTLFRRLGVFVGGCTLAAAKVVCDARRDLPLDVLDGLATLVDTSLLRREEGQDGETRFTMLDTIHDYAIERLETSGEAEILQQQHAAYLLTLAERIMIESLRPGQAALRGGIDAENANLRAALRYAAACGEIETGARLALAWAWVWRNNVAEGRRWFETFLQHRSNLPIALQVKAFNQAGDLATIQGDYTQAQTLLEQSLALARELGDQKGIATALDLLGFAARAQGDYQPARKFLEQSQALSEELGDKMTLAVTLLRLGSLLFLQGDYTQAMVRCQESLTLAEELQDALLVAWVFHIMGELAQLQGDTERARTLLAKSLPVFQTYGDVIGIISHLEGMAQIAGLEGKPARLVRLFGAVERLRATHGGSAYTSERAAFERQLLAAHAQLGESSYVAAWRAGQTLTLEQALAYALGEDP